jgi:hypothetical protein
MAMPLKCYYDTGSGTVDISDCVKSATWGLGMTKAYQRISGASRLRINLTNHDGRFSPENSSGPYYGSLLPNKQVNVYLVYDGAEHPFWVGWTETIDASSAIGRKYEASIDCVGVKQTYQRANLRMAGLSDISSGTALEEIILSTRLPPAGTYVFDPGSEHFEFIGESWDAKTTAWEAISDIVLAERGHFWFDRGGTAVFRDREYAQKNYQNDGTVTEGDEYVQGISYSYGGMVYNVIRASAVPREVGASDILWQLDSPISVAGGGTTTVEALFRGSSNEQIGGQNVGTPSGADFDTDGGHLSVADMTVYATSASISIANSGNTTHTCETLVVRGDKVTAFNRVERVAEDESSKTEYGIKERDLGTDLLDDPKSASRAANYELSLFADPRGMVESITVNSRGSSFILDYTMGDRISVQAPSLSHYQEYMIIGEEHSWSAPGEKHTVKYFLEPLDTQPFMLIGITGRGEIGTAVLGF